MLINMWYAAEESTEVRGDRPMRVKMLGHRFALFRDEVGKAHCVSDVCVHRGASLGKHGKIKNGCLECPYHGWNFDGDGRCRLVPAAGPGKPITRRARLDSYPTVERYGLIWVFLGDLPERERPPLPEYPEYDDPQRWKIVRGRFFWRANYTRVVENGIDPAHAAFVHGNLFGNPDDPTIPEVEVEDHDWGSVARVSLARPPVKGIFKYLRREANREQVDVKVEVSTHLSGMHIMLRQDMGPKMKMALFDVNTPVDAHHTRTFWILARSFLRADWADFDTHRRNMMVFEQDRRVVEDIEPGLVPDLSDEVSVKSDVMQIAFRKKHQELVDRGWSIDVASQTAAGTDRAHVIPCPGRREPGTHWVLEPIPLVAAKGEAVVEEAAVEDALVAQDSSPPQGRDETLTPLRAVSRRGDQEAS